MKRFAVSVAPLACSFPFAVSDARPRDRSTVFCVTGCACEGFGYVQNKFALRRDEFADSLTSWCVSTRQQGKCRKTQKKERKKCTVRTGGVKLWEADREKMSVPTHFKFTHSQKCDWKSPVCPGYLSHNII